MAPPAAPVPPPAAPAKAPPAAPAKAPPVPPVLPPPPAPFALNLDPVEFCQRMGLTEEKGWSYCTPTGHKVRA
eukprot:6242286-Pyramimonas_sp.AAC.1